MEFEVSYNPSYTKKVWVFANDANLDGEWLIAYQRLYSGINQTRMDNAMQQVSAFCADNGGLAIAPYLRIVPGAADWSTVRTTLPQENTRNFYFWGHGSPTRIGFGANDSLNGVRALQMRSLLGNTLVGGTATIWHAFRFVFLDGCQTGTADSLWPETFGIVPVVDDLETFIDLGSAPRAFCGWKKTIATSSFDTSRFSFTERFFENWLSIRQNLQTALLNAMTATIGSSQMNSLQIWGYPLLDPQ